MRRQGIFDNSSDSFLRHLNNDEDGQISSNNHINSGQSQTSDLQKLSSSIICSANITRKSLLQESTVTSRSNNYTVDDDNDDDDEFFKTIKLNIDRNLLQNSKENYKPNSTQSDLFAQKRKKPIIDEETLKVIKRFKKDANMNRANFLETSSNNMSPRRSKSFFNNTIRHPYELPPRNINIVKNVMTQQNTKTCSVDNLPASTNDIGNIVRQKSTISYPMYNLPTSTNNIRNIVRQENTIRCPNNLPPSTNDIRNIVGQENTIRCPYNLPASRNDIGHTVRQENTIRCPYNLPPSTNDIRNIVGQENTIRCPYNLPPSTNDIRNIVGQENTIRCPYNLPASRNDIGHTVRQENAISCPMYNSQSTNDIRNIMKPQNIFKSNVVNAHIRNPDEHMFQMRSKIRKDNILPLNRNEMAIVRTECEQVLLYATTCCFITPPRKNFSEGN